jgi:hypothetical protein
MFRERSLGAVEREQRSIMDRKNRMAQNETRFHDKQSGVKAGRYPARIGQTRMGQAAATLALFAFSPILACAVSCQTQAAMSGPERDVLITEVAPLADAVAKQNLDLLQASLLPAVVGDWEGIRSAAQAAKPLLQGGTIQLRSGYLLDATDLKSAGDTQFFCTNADNSVTVTVNLRGLPPGRYALVIADYAGAPMAGQLALILGQDATQGGKWKLGGLFAREGALDGHDGLWYWVRARALAKKDTSWSAWFTYDAARALLLPVDFVSTPNMEKLNQEQLQLKSPSDALPITLAGVGTYTGISWKLTGARLDLGLHEPDLALTYEGTGLTDPVAAKSEAVGVMAALLRLQPTLRENFHGFWAYAMKDGKQTFAIEVAMKDVPN